MSSPSVDKDLGIENGSKKKPASRRNSEAGVNGKADEAKSTKYTIPKDEYSVFKDINQRNELFQHLPLAKVKKIRKNPKINSLASGPNQVQYPMDEYAKWICGRSISTYPCLPGRPTRDGEPICDSYAIHLLEDNVTLTAVADGCNWGKRPEEASNRAKDAFVAYLRSQVNEIRNVRDAGHYLLNALSYAHVEICRGKEDVWEAGTTTILGGMVLPLKPSKDAASGNYPYVWVCVTVGDCKAFHYSKETGATEDITEGNRKNVYDARDCGGRLGPYIGEGEPDLRNCAVHYRYCQEEDIIIILSDGVHDNLDPQTLGKLPKDVGPQYSHIEHWQAFANDEEVQKAKTEFMLNMLSKELIGGDVKRAKLFSLGEEESPQSPENIVNRVMKHCLNATAKGREWMEQNPKEKLPMDYVLYPGKMDHTTCVAIRVGKF